MGAAGELYTVLEHSQAKIYLEIKSEKYEGMLRNQILAPVVWAFSVSWWSEFPVAHLYCPASSPSPTPPLAHLHQPWPAAAPTGVKLTPTGP